MNGLVSIKYICELLFPQITYNFELIKNIPNLENYSVKQYGTFYEILVIFILGAIISFMIFFPFVVAPTIFKNLNERQTKLVLRSFFPKYYLYGMVLSVIGTIFCLYEKDLILIFSFVFLLISFILLQN